MCDDLIDEFEAGGSRLAESVSGLSTDQLTARPGPGKWSIHELVIHLVDADAIAIDRMKRVIAEDNPTLLYADETAYVDTLFPHDQSIEDAVTLFVVNRRQFARVLRRLPEEAFARTGTHNIAGRVSLEGLVRMYVDHLDHHFEFLKRKREKLIGAS